MNSINEIDLRRVDTTILLVFLGIMRHRKATAVAHEMGLTQPAVSHALKRLRNLYNDPLFLRRAHGLEPTALAHELEPKVRRIVRLISETLDGAEAFDPGTATTTGRTRAPTSRRAASRLSTRSSTPSPATTSPASTPHCRVAHRQPEHLRPRLSASKPRGAR